MLLGSNVVLCSLIHAFRNLTVTCAKWHACLVYAWNGVACILAWCWLRWATYSMLNWYMTHEKKKRTSKCSTFTIQVCKGYVIGWIVYNYVMGSFHFAHSPMPWHYLQPWIKIFKRGGSHTSYSYHRNALFIDLLSNWKAVSITFVTVKLQNFFTAKLFFFYVAINLC